MDSACLPDLSPLMAVTTAVLELGSRVAAGDMAAAAEVSALAGLLAIPTGR